MNVTTRHPGSRHGQPVILDALGRKMDYGHGINDAMRLLGLTRAALARHAGINVRTLDAYRMGSYPPSAAFLNVLGDLLADQQAAQGKP